MHDRGQRHLQGRCFPRPFHHQIPDPAGQTPKGLMLILYYPELHDSLLQMGNQRDLAISQSKNKVINPRARILEMPAPLSSLLEPSNHFAHNIRLRSVDRQSPKYGLAARDTSSHSTDNRMTTSVWWTSASLIPSCRGAYGRSPVMVIHSSDPLRFRRGSSWTRRPHCSSTTTR
jgi:hypothetical protein